VAGSGVEGDCFARATSADLVYKDGTKAAGGAQARRSTALLEQVAIPLQPDSIPAGEVFRGRAGTRSAVLSTVPLETLIFAIREELSLALRVVFAKCSWPVDLFQRAVASAPSFLVDTSSSM